MSYPGKIGIVGGGSRKTLSQMALQYNRPTNLFNVYTPGAGVQSGGRASNPGIRRALARRAQLKPGTMDKPHTGRCGGLCDNNNVSSSSIYCNTCSDMCQGDLYLTEDVNPGDIIIKVNKPNTCFKIGDELCIYSDYPEHLIVNGYGSIKTAYPTNNSHKAGTTLKDISGVSYNISNTTYDIPVSNTTFDLNDLSNNSSEITKIIFGSNLKNITNNKNIIFPKLNSLSLSNKITTLGNNVFYNSNLISVNFSNSLTTIGDYAFYNGNLTNIKLPNSLVTIGGNAFASNNLSANVNIGPNVTTIGYNAFSNNSNFIFSNSNLNPIQINITSKNTTNIENFELTYDNTTNNQNYINLTNYDGISYYTYLITNIIIPNYVTSIGGFMSNNLTEIIIPDNVQTIIASAFLINKLTYVRIGSGVTHINNLAFADNKLTNIHIPKNVIHIGDYAFDVNKLASVTIPEYVKYIGNGAFRDNNIEIITFNGNVFDITLGTQIFQIQHITGNITIRSNVSYGNIESILTPQFNTSNLVFEPFL